MKKAKKNLMKEAGHKCGKLAGRSKPPSKPLLTLNNKPPKQPMHHR